MICAKMPSSFSPSSSQVCMTLSPSLSNILKKLLIFLLLFFYITAGIRTSLLLVSKKPVPLSLLEDFNAYRRAAIEANASMDPYRIRQIGPAFLYPPPALLFVDAFRMIPNKISYLETALFISINLALLLIMVYGVAHLYQQDFRDTWWWYLLCIGFAPFFELELIGQINMITAFGIFLLIYYEKRSSSLAGFGLAIGFVTKFTPLSFFGYLFIRKEWKTMLAAVVSILGFSLLAVFRYGYKPFITFVEVLRSLLTEFSFLPNSQALVTKILAVFPSLTCCPDKVQRAEMVYFLFLLGISALLTLRKGSPREPLFLLVALVTALSPNVMWYHHYVFLLLPLLILLGWSRNNLLVTIWVFVFMIVIQLDRAAFSEGIAIHLLGQITILGILGWQAYTAFQAKKKQIKVSTYLPS